VTIDEPPCGGPTSLQGGSSGSAASRQIVSSCGESLKASNRHLDHILPLCVGGKHLKINVRYLCGLCNCRRPRDGSMSQSKF
jgi:hypothetical protein